MYKKIVVGSFLGLLGMSMSVALTGCIQQKEESKAHFPPESELDQDEDPYPDEYLQDEDLRGAKKGTKSIQR